MVNTEVEDEVIEEPDIPSKGVSCGNISIEKKRKKR